MTDVRQQSPLRATGPAADEPPRDGPPTYESSELFRGARVITISHAGETYRLLLTRNNRLLLQK